jgi:tetratricopeptide (TPR) repeat protein
MGLGGPFVPGSRGPLTPSEGGVKALAAARHAVELDPNLAEAHTSLGGVLEWFEWDNAGAEREYKRALELNPDYATAHQRYGVFLGTTAGQFDEGAAELKRALQLDPASLPINADLGFNYYSSRRYDEAIEQARKTLELDPNWPRARFLLAQSYTEKGAYDEALREMEKMGLPRQGPNFVRLYVLMGRREEGLKILAEMQERSKRQYVGPLGFAIAYASLGDKERAFEYLEKAFAERSPGLRNIKKMPAFDDLHSDPRFADLVKRIGLPP